MKNLRTSFILMLIMLILCSCANQSVKKEGQISIVSSFYPIYLATANIVDGVEDVSLVNLTSQTTGCLHDYQITTQDMVKLNNADILVINGDGMENFIDKAISTYPNLKIINASEGIKDDHDELLNIQNENDEHHHEHGTNSHYWVSISLYIKQVQNIKNRLCELDEKNSQQYEINAQNYINKLEDLRKKMHQELDGLNNKNIVAFHEAFDYFAEEFDLNIVAVIEREPGTYPSSKDVANIIDEIKKNNVNAIFTEPQYSKTAANTIARETNVKVYELDPIVTGNLDKEAYISIMTNNLEVLKEALK